MLIRILIRIGTAANTFNFSEISLRILSLLYLGSILISIIPDIVIVEK